MIFSGLLKAFTVLLLVISASTQNAYGQEECEACHDVPEMVHIESGIPSSIYVNQSMIDNSVHDGLSCIDCHVSLDGFEDFPHPEKQPNVNCADCHSDAFETFMSGFYDHLQQRGFSSVPGCTQCHGNHEITQEVNTQMVCGICHKYATQTF